MRVRLSIRSKKGKNGYAPTKGQQNLTTGTLNSEDTCSCCGLAPAGFARIRAFLNPGSSPSKMVLSCKLNSLLRQLLAGSSLPALWYRRAAQQGYALALHNLASASLNGRGVPVDQELA